MMNILLAWQQFWAQWKAGDVRVLLLALIVAVTAITGVTFFTSRIGYHLNNQGGLVLGGDMVMIADHPIPEKTIHAAKAQGLSVTETIEFPSMAIVGDKNQLAEIKALNNGFPLRGNLTVQFSADAPAMTIQAIPKQGEVWIEPRLANLLSLRIGDAVELGATQLTVAGLLIREPSRGGDMFSFAPRLMMNALDLEKTELIQYGSRVKYQLLVAGDNAAVEAFGQEVKPTLQRGERIQDLKTARPEIKSALDKAETFLGLSAMVSILLSIAAMLLASGPYISRNIQTAALLRCFGASKNQIQQILLWQCAFIALIGATVGCLLGYLLQHVLGLIAGSLFLDTLPAPNLIPVYVGFGVSFSVLFALMMPNIFAIKNSPIVNILRTEIETKAVQAGLRFIPVMIVVALIIFSLAKSIKLALAIILGMLGLCILSALLAYLFANLIYQFSQSVSRSKSGLLNMAKLGLANLKRNRLLTIAQVVGFSLSAMVLILLMIIKSDLLNAWQDSLPADAPNRFVINIQPTQTEAIKKFVKEISVTNPQVFPMIRGRLVKQNNQIISPDLYEDERAKRLASREFNLSMAEKMQADNQLLEGRWWRTDEFTKPLVSIEQDIAEALNIKLGDVLTYDIAGREINLTVASIRKVEWDSMRANFFAVTPPETLADYPASYMTAFYLKQSQSNQLDQLVKKFPNLTVIDVASLMNQVREIMQKMSMAVAYVFALCVVAGLIVLYAALVATRDIRAKEASLLRVFGASRKQVSVAMIVEYLGIAFIAASVALLIANIIAYYVSTYLFDIPFTINIMLSASAYLIALLLIPSAAWLVIRTYLNQPPKQVLHSI
jgi:putative ABC transport system permease protein